MGMRPMMSWVPASTMAIAGAAPISSATYSLPFAKATSPGCEPDAIATVATTSPLDASKPRMVLSPRFATQSVPFTLRCSPGPASAAAAVANATTRAKATNVRVCPFISPPWSEKRSVRLDDAGELDGWPTTVSVISTRPGLHDGTPPWHLLQPDRGEHEACRAKVARLRQRSGMTPEPLTSEPKNRANRTVRNDLR